MDIEIEKLKQIIDLRNTNHRKIMDQLTKKVKQLLSYYMQNWGNIFNKNDNFNEDVQLNDRKYSDDKRYFSRGRNNYDKLITITTVPAHDFQSITIETQDSSTKLSFVEKWYKTPNLKKLTMDNNNYNNEKEVENRFKQTSFCHAFTENLVFDDG